MADTVHVLRLQRTDVPSQHLLLHITQKSLSKPLDLKLVATEHEHLYHGSTQGSKIASLQAKTFTGNEEEFRDIVYFSLLQTRPEGCSPEFGKGLETVGTVEDDTVTVTIRKNIGGITQRVATLKLDQDDEREEVNVFSWVDAAVLHGERQTDKLETLGTKYEAAQDQIARLTAQLDELVRAKKQQEDELLRKFTILLNTKKLKIRDQQRLLQGADADFEASAGVAHGHKRHTAGASAQNKRKAAVDADVDEEDAAMDDEALAEDTPPDTDEGASDLDEDADGTDALSRSRAHPGTASNRTGQGYDQMSTRRKDDSDADSPPTRKLPLGREKGEAEQASKQPVQDLNDDETDDEL